MNLTTLKTSASSALAHAKFAIHKRSPEIFLGLGIATIVGGTVAACIATRKLDLIFEDYEDARDTLELDKFDAEESILQLKETADVEWEEDVRIAREEEEQRALSVINSYSRNRGKLTVMTGVKIVKAYLPAVILVSSGIVMVVNGHRILLKRNAELLAAYSALDEMFTRYRSAVCTKYGLEADEELYSGRVTKIETRTEMGEDGKKSKVKEQVTTIGEGNDPYASLFDETTSMEWTRSPDLNLMTLKCQQNAMNDLLKSRHRDGRHRRGFVFLNEVYHALGLPETPTGAICGWLMPEEGEDPEGDDYIDFGLSLNRCGEENQEALLRFLNGDEASVWLHFNCQGMIYDKI